MRGKGVKLKDENGGIRKLSRYYMQMTVLVTETRDYLQHIVSERACDSIGLKINVGKSKVLMIKKDQVGSYERLRVNEEEMQGLSGQV